MSSSIIHATGKTFLKLALRGGPSKCAVTASEACGLALSRQLSICILRRPCFQVATRPNVLQSSSRSFRTTAFKKNEKAAVNEKFLRPNKAKKGGVTFRSIMLGIGAFSVGTTVFALSLPEEASKVWTSIGGEYALQQINNYMEPEAKDISLPDWPPHFGRQPRYTLVIGLEETLVHSTWTRKFGWRHAKRPGCDQFLKSLRDYEIVIFSNGSLNFTQDIIHQIADVNQVFAWRLGAEDMRPVSGTSIKAKDIAGLNRPMDRIIVLDSNTEAFHLNPENAIPISKFDDPSKKDDTELLNLIPFFQDMAFLDTDTRKVIARYPDPSKIGETYLQQKEIDEKVHVAKKAKGLGSLLKGWK